MRFFSGVRGSGDKKKITASQRFKEAQNKGPKIEKTQDEKYKEMIAAKIQKLTEDAMMGIKKGGFKMPGTKEEPRKEMSKNAKLMMKLLAMQKLQKEAKIEKKKLKEMVWKEKSEKKAKAFAKAQQEENIAYQKRMEDEAAAAAAAAATPSTSWWGVGSSDDKSGW